MKEALHPFLIKIKGVGKFQRLLGAGVDSVNLKSGSVVLEPGESIGAHVTESKEEFIIIIKGKADVQLEAGRLIRARRLSAVYIPPETTHDVKNSGTSVLHYIYVVCPVTRTPSGLK